MLLLDHKYLKIDKFILSVLIGTSFKKEMKKDKNLVKL